MVPGRRSISTTHRDRRRAAASLVLSLATLGGALAFSVTTTRAESASATTASPQPSQAGGQHTVAIPAECQNAASFDDVAGQGPTCQAHGKMVVRLRNGAALTVAPPDTVKAMAATTAPAGFTATPGSPTLACVDPSTHPHVELYYAFFAGSSDNFASHVADIQSQFEQVDSGYVDYDSRYYNGPEMHLYVECDASGNPVVHDIGLSTPLSSSSFSTIVSDMQSQGHTSSLAHYWVWTDGNPTSGYAGQSSVIGDDSIGASNAINASNAYSINYGFAANNGGAGIFAHENGHAMGAVQLSAPDSTGAWHCTDGRDVMCYNDGGPNGNAYTTADCGNNPVGMPPLDCHRDDYFNPCPAPGSYLSGHWNIASVNNAWVRVSAAPTSTAFYYPPQKVIEGTQTTLSVMVSGAGCGGGTVTFTYSGHTLGTGGVGSNGIASVSLASLPLGQYSVSASFSGSATALASSTASAATFSVVPPPFKSLDVMDEFGGAVPVQPSLIGTQADQWPTWGIARGMVLTPDGTGGYVLDGLGGVQAFGSAPPVNVSAYWSNWDIARGIVLRPDGKSGYVLDGLGGVHPFGAAGDMPPSVSVTAYWPNWDIAHGIVLRSDGQSGYVLDAWGGVHPFGGAPSLGISAYWFGWGIARGITLNADGAGGYVLDGLGGLHPFGNAANVAPTGYWPNWDIARAVVTVPGASGQGWVLDGLGGVSPYGGAPSVSISSAGYWGRDVARAIAAV